MTYDEIMKLEAGKELDALIAEKVMGEKKPLYSHEHPILTQTRWSVSLSWYCSPEWDNGDICEWIPKPYSKDIQFAWEIVNKSNSFGIDNHISQEESADGVVSWNVEIIFERWGEANAETAPLAICRAALCSVIGEPK